MADIKMYVKGWCPFCRKAKSLLDAKSQTYTELDIDREPELREQMIAESGAFTVPQIFINGAAVGGCDDLFALEAQGKLDTLLN